MALPQKPFTADQIRALLVFPEPPESLFKSEFLMALAEPKRGRYVRYDATLNRTVFEDPNTFYLCDAASPTDSRWLVPGTEESEARPRPIFYGIDWAKPEPPYCPSCGVNSWLFGCWCHEVQK